MFDGEQFGKDLVGLVKGFMEREVAPLRAENKALSEQVAELKGIVTEQNGKAEQFAAEFGDTLGKMVADAIASIELPEPKGVDPEALEAAVSSAVAALPAPQDGKSVTVEELAPVIKEQVDAAVAEIVLPEPKEVDAEELKGMVQEAVNALPVPQDGKSVTVEELEPVVKAAVDAAVEAIELPEPEKVDLEQLKAIVQGVVRELPVPQDGKSVTLEELQPVVLEAVQKAVGDLPPPKDGEPGQNGLNVRNMLIDKDGRLRCIMADGTDHDLGVVVGKNGEPGQPGLGFDDMDVQVLEDDRTIELSFRRGEEEKAFTVKWPTVIDRGVFKEKREYAAGDGVSWGGSFWIAQRDTSEKPDAPDSGWRLAVKKGRDGRNTGKGD
jgi:hypothetical protein